jgi:uncharacterized protein
MHDKLTDDELSTLDAFLDSPAVMATSMDVATMQGYFAALAIGPRTIMPSQWMPWIWDMDDGEAQPAFADVDEANALMQLVLRHYNGVVREFIEAPASFRPLYEQDSQWSASAWCDGFLLGVELGDGDWTPLWVSQPAWLAPFTRLGTADGMALTEKHGDAEVWIDQILPSLQKIHGYWLEQRASAPEGQVEDDFRFGTGASTPHMRTAPKVGRNDPCPCGSGKKFKKCCAAAGQTLH